MLKRYISSYLNQIIGYIYSIDGDYLKKKDIEVDSIVDEYKMSMGGCFFSKIDYNDNNYDLEHELINDVIENHIYNLEKLLHAYDELSSDKKRELFYKALHSLIDANKK